MSDLLLWTIERMNNLPKIKEATTTTINWNKTIILKTVQITCLSYTMSKDLSSFIFWRPSDELVVKAERGENLADSSDSLEFFRLWTLPIQNRYGSTKLTRCKERHFQIGRWIFAIWKKTCNWSNQYPKHSLFSFIKAIRITLLFLLSFWYQQYQWN